MVDDRTRREIELMNGLAKVDHEHRVLQEEMEKKINEKEELLESVREEYEELGLVYNEEEVKAALEVKYLLEQMDKIEKEKERIEQENKKRNEEVIWETHELTNITEQMLDELKKEFHTTQVAPGEDVDFLLDELRQTITESHERGSSVSIIRMEILPTS